MSRFDGKCDFDFNNWKNSQDEDEDAGIEKQEVKDEEKENTYQPSVAGRQELHQQR